ncbi:MAG: hypothetical protein ACD_50C00069G0003 [uncultured bacterium]|nr:MAG: hypothetical protein ACD_50C00069G0003 [uncultured bacterium]
MELDYFYRKTPLIEKYLHNLDVLRKVVDLLPPLPHLEENLRRKSLLKSALYSAKIEGNRLKLDDLNANYSYTNSQSLEKKEIYNILHAAKKIYAEKSVSILNADFILELHQMVLKDIAPDAGNFRTEPSAIFNQAGVAIYMTPPPNKIKELMNKLIKQVNNSREPGPVNAAVSHFIFEKIHPFLDGNGRIGRLISTYILHKHDYSFRGLASLEEYINNNRQTYYDLLSLNQKDITGFVEFFLEALNNQAELAVESIKYTPSEKPEDTLLPRRREILEIIRDHQTVSFDSLRRRFYKIPDSTLHYDLKKLQETGFIRKLGTTRGVLYTPKREIEI